MYSKNLIKRAEGLRSLYGDKWTQIARELGKSESGIRGYFHRHDELRESPRAPKQENQVELPKQENNWADRLNWVRENANHILSFYLECKDKEGTAKYFGLSGYSLCIAFHMAGRDDLIYPSFLKSISNYPIEPKLEPLKSPELLQRTLVSIKPTGDNFHANLIAFFKEVEENDQKIIELQAQVNELTDERNNYKTQVVELRQIAVQMKEIMARGD